jgi:anti-anti-sigma factor
MQGEPDFEVTSRPTLDGVVVSPRGEIDLATIDDVGAQIERAHDARHVYLDLREVTFIDSAGVRLIVESARDLAARGAELVLIRGTAAVQRVFDLVGLDGHVRMLDAPPGE